MIKWLNSKGHAGEIVGKLLNKYRKKVLDMFASILKKEAAEVIKLIESVRDDVIVIINGGHIKPGRS